MTYAEYKEWKGLKEKEIKPKRKYTPRRKFPREMMISIKGDKWIKRLVFGKIKASNPYITNVFESDTSGDCLMGVKYAKEIETKVLPDFDWDKYESKEV